MREEYLGEMSTANYFALPLESPKTFNKMFKKILFGEKALSAMNKSNGKTVVSGRLIPVVENGKQEWEFVPYNRIDPNHHKMKVVDYLPEGWIKIGVRRMGVYSSASNRLSPEEAVEQLKHDICEGLDRALKDGHIEDMRDYVNFISK